nr:peptide chain release factor N(5)-glutamine methyltransferase [Aureimonas populi]
MAETLGALLARARARLRAGGLESPDLDARLLAQEALGLDAAGLFLRAPEPVEPGRAARFDALLARRLAGEPVHRILGRRDFFAHEFELSADTLEPRPDTEVLVELAARAFRGLREDILFADVGTGSGAIAVSLLALFPRAQGLALDLAEGALATARRNADQAGVRARFHPVASDYLSAIGGRLDAIVSNPPYIPSADIAGLDAHVREHDPRLALDGGPDGLDAYRRIVDEARGLLGEGGALLLEIGAGQAGDVTGLAEAAGFELCEHAADLGGHVRALWFNLRREARNTGKGAFFEMKAL